jgi:hypothetical protein
VRVPKGELTVSQVLDALKGQSRLSRYAAEEGHGVWVYDKGRTVPFPACGATLWDRTSVRAYDVSAQLRHRSPEAILASLRKRVDPGKWDSGLPAAAVFLPTRRLLVVHDESGHRRVGELFRLSGPRPFRLPIPPEPEPGAPRKEPGRE